MDPEATPFIGNTDTVQSGNKSLKNLIDMEASPISPIAKYATVLCK